MTDDKHQMFSGRYAAGNIPWDTGITPPEIAAIVDELSPGKALDLGCGTGTNVHYLLEHGWQADGVDFVQQAVDIARAKVAAFPDERYRLVRHDVTQLKTCAALRPPYDLLVDIGCGHSIPAEQEAAYGQDVADLLAPGGVYMLFAHMPTAERRIGWRPADVRRIFLPHFTLVWQALNDDTTTGFPSGWYHLEKINFANTSGKSLL
jgi:SAM-dependent methyltransferase